MKYEYIKEIVLQAGKKALEDFRLEIRTEEKEPYDLVTDTDRKIELYISTEIKKYDSEAVFYGEEYGKTGDSGDRLYIIDPVDGTANFVFGVPWFAVSVALAEKGTITAAAVFNPVSGDFYYADDETQALHNGKEIRTGTCDKIEESLIIFGFSAHRKNIERYIADWAELFDNARKGLPLLSPSLNLCLVAQGKADAFIDFGCSMFGKSAGAFILQKAGGKVRNYSGQEYNYHETGIVAVNSKLRI